MEYKRSMIIILLTIFIFSIASVCASDVDDTLLAGGDSQLTDEIIQASENQEVEIQDMDGDDLNSNEDDSPIKDMDRLKDSNDNELQESSIIVTNHTFKAIQDAIGNGYDTIYLEEGIYNGTSLITIYRDNIRLIGVYNSTILDGKHQTQILEISGNNNVKIENITFINGQKGHGGAIYWDNSDNGSISNCNFINNSASYGGAIDWVESNNGSISNCNFINNSAGIGGAFRWDNSNNGSISNCNFINNSAGIGGAFRWEKSDNGNVSYCNFINNSANKVETIDWDGSDGSVSGCSFIDYNSDVIHSNDLLDANYCWFGKNATNYDDGLPISLDVDCTYSLFLNAVADSTTLDPSGTANVVFKLFLYNSTSGNISEYDNSPFDYVNLEITKTNGNVSKNITGLDDAITYTADSSGTGSVTASIGNTSYTIEFDIKEVSNLTVGSQEVYYSNNTILNLNYTSTATGKVNITLKGNKNDYNFKDIDLNKSISLGIISPDTYDVNISYSGDETFAPSNAIGKLTVIPIVDLEIKIETDPLCEELYVNDTILFTVTVKNNGPCNATDVNVSEILSSLLRMVSYNTDAGDYDVNEGIWHIGNLSRDDCKVLNISARVISVGNITNEVNVTGVEYDSNLSNNRANISAIKALPLVDLEITKEVNSEDIHINDLIIFTITVKNNGPCDATDVNVSEILSTHLKMDQYVTWDSYYDVDEGIWYIGYLSNNDWRQLVIYANVSSVGNFTNEVNVTSAEKDSNLSNNKAKVEIRAKPIVDLSTNISSDNKIYFIGDLAEWTITVYNAGNGSNATNIELDEWFPSQYFEFIVAIPDIGTYNETSKVWKIESLENGTKATLQIIAYSTAIRENVNNRVVVACDEDDWDINNNLAYNYVDVTDLPEPAITASNNTPHYNDEIIYTIGIKNNASANYTGVLTVRDSLPYGMNLIQIESVTGADEILPAEIDGGHIEWYLTNITAESTAQITFRVKVTTIGNLTSNLKINGTFIGYNKTANCTVEAQPIVDLSVEKTAPDNCSFGDIISWTITVHNAANGTDATDVTLYDYFPGDNFEIINITTENGTVTENVTNSYYLWNIGFMANGTDATMTIVSRATNAREDILNYASVFSDEDEWDYENNVARKTVTVEKVDSSIELNDTVMDYGQTANISAITEGATGITAQIGEDELTVDNFTITVPILDAGNYTLTVTTVPDSNHNPVTKNATVTVNKLNTELTGSAVSTVYNVNKNLVISLKDINGNPLSGLNITVNLNGAKTYTTDSNGQVKVSTNGLSPKSYTAKINFDGDNNYENSSKEIKVTVKKANPKLTASTKTYKTSTKVKKYTITLKDNTGKAISKAKVTLKVNGKTYKATTNSKGKATFNIKLNKAGTFKATVTFNANKYYNKVTKKVNIKVISTFKTVSKGSKDKAIVKQIQQALKDNGYYLSYKGHYLKVDGIYHDCTVRSVKEFQRDKGLKVTGKVDEKTAKKLKIIS